MPPAHTIVRFGVVADCHYADRPTYLGRDCRKAVKRLAECVAAFGGRIEGVP